MVKRSFEYVLDRIKCATKVVIVGAGQVGRELSYLLHKYNISVFEIFDNKSNDVELNGVPIVRPYNLNDDKCIYIITMADLDIRHAVKLQLLELRIDESQIVIYHNWRDYEYLKNLDEKYYKEEISEVYKEYFGKELNWNNPQTYTEKMAYEKLYNRDVMKTVLADKFKVRDWIREKIGEEYLTKLYGVWDKAEDIDFDVLPDKFAIKTNNGSGRNIIVEDKKKIDKKAVCKQLDVWLNSNYAYTEEFQLHYKDIEPKIICEEYLEGIDENAYEYSMYCFHGEPTYIHCVRESHKPGWKASFYDAEWNKQGFKYGCPLDSVTAPRPELLDEMLSLSRILSKDFKHVRVDWYNLPDGKLLFGEMTFTPWGSLKAFVPEKWDKVFGDLMGNMCGE